MQHADLNVRIPFPPANAIPRGYEWEHSRDALCQRINDMVFTKWGAGLALLALGVGSGVAFAATLGAGLYVAGTIMVIGLFILIFNSYANWKIDQVPRTSHLEEAVLKGNLAKVDTLLEILTKELQGNDPFAEFNMMEALKTAILTGNNPIVRKFHQTLLGVHQEHHLRIRESFLDYAAKGNMDAFRIMTGHWRNIPREWYTDVVHLGRLEATTALLAAYPDKFREFSVQDVYVLMANGGEALELIANTFAETWQQRIWEMNIILIFNHLCQKGLQGPVANFCRFLPPGNVPQHLVNGFCDAAKLNKQAVVTTILETNRMNKDALGRAICDNPHVACVEMLRKHAAARGIALDI